MKVFRLGTDKIERVPDASVTIGTYDGVHLGHQKILRRIISGGGATVITFDPHPQHVLKNKPGMVKIITPIEEKLRKLEILGIERTIIIPFNKEFANIEAEVFIKDILVDTIGLKRLIVGFNHAFGRNREGNTEFLEKKSKEYNYKLEVVTAQEMEGIAISSTKIRQAISDGHVEIANDYLGWPYRINGEVVEGDKRGRKLGYPTANIKIINEHQLIPCEGVYAIRVGIGGNWYTGVGSIGKLPTFGENRPLTVEAHIFDLDMDLYGRTICVEWLSFLRPQEKFKSPDELIARMNEDSQRAREIHRINGDS